MNRRSSFLLTGYSALFAALLLVVSSTLVAASTVEFLGQDTGIMDRVTDSGDLLSAVLTELDRDCNERSLEEARDKLQKKLDKGEVSEESSKFLKERSKRYFKCLKKEVKVLKKSDVVSKDEEKVLKEIIKQAKKDGTIIDPEPTTESTVNGRITLPDGTVLNDVQILASSGTDEVSETSDDGLFSLGLEADTGYVLRLSGAGLADQVVPVMSPALGSAISLEITMIGRGKEQTFTAGAGNLTGADGAAVDVNGISWVDAMGNPISGEITARITPVDVSNSAALGAFPGEFSGIATGAAEEGAIVSYGVVEFEFSQNGAPVQPAPGQLVNVLIPIYFDQDQDGNTFVGGEIIPLWSLNEETGVWEQDGTGVVVPAESPSGWALQAEVSHFSWWNCDVSMNAATAYVTVIGDQPGSAIVKATTNADIGWRPNSVETVVTVGVESGPLNVPSTGTVCFSADITYDDGTEATTLEVCVDPPEDGTVNIELFAPTPGPLNITATPMGDIDGFVNFPIERVRLFPTSLETSVSYSIIAGNLPNGMSLIQTTSTRAEIAGVPTQPGLFSVTVEGTDGGAETDSLVINYDISSDVPPPVFSNNFIFVELVDTNDSYDLNDDLDLVNGGAADSWMLLEDIEGGPIPDWLELDSSTGVLSINDNVDDRWFGRIKVTNASGEDEKFIEVCAGSFCGQES